MRFSKKTLVLSLFPIVIAILVAIIMLTNIMSFNEYNNGICRDCGGRFVYQEAVGHRRSTHYIYICENCGNLVETPVYHKGVK